MSNPITEAYRVLCNAITDNPNAISDATGIDNPDQFLDLVYGISFAYTTMTDEDAPSPSTKITPYPDAIISCYEGIVEAIKENPGAVNEDGINYVAQFNDLTNRIGDALPILLAAADALYTEMEERHEMREGYYGEVHPCERDDMSDEYERDFDYPY